ncbi:MAG: DUF1549 and DUF1553 domain-containing protein [Gemmataceae bacterium]
MRTSVIIVGLLFCSPFPARAADPVALAVYPPDVQLNSSRDKGTFVVQATSADGITTDVTAQADVTFADNKLIRRDGATLYPLADGTTQMAVKFGGQSVNVPVTVRQAATDRPISFNLDVMPVFMRSGCNSGACHGAARGKDGFRLSLFGFDPEGDYYRLTREQPGRRVNMALPAESMLLEKPTAKVPHTGGQRLKEGDESYQTLLRWLDAGAPRDKPDIAKPTTMEVYPPGLVLDGKDSMHRLAVRARYSDGSVRDVTHLAIFLSNNDVSAKVSPDGVVTAGERGEAFVMARFATFTVGIPVVVLPKGIQFQFPEVPENNYIDGLVHAKLKKIRISPSELCSDEEFLRRATLDITGVLPTLVDYDRFMADSSADKRVKLIDDLLSRKEFAELWVMKWAELLQIRSSERSNQKAILLYFNWLQDRIQRNVPVNEWVKELLTASGGTFANPATNYFQVDPEPVKVSENVAQVFMGMRIQCAHCHNHPFDRWTMDDYYGFAAFFSQVGRKAGDDPREQVVFNAGGGESRHPVGGRVVKPKYLGGAEPEIGNRDRREVLAGWLASPDNPYFASNLANIVWAHFFGRGIIHEVDDVRVSNPPSNPELLAELGQRFTDYHYDFKKLVRDICLSRTYQLATKVNETNAGDARNFSHAAVRRIRAESLLDCLMEVTEAKEKFPGLPLGARAVEIPDGSRTTYFLTVFGRSTRQTVCSCEVKLEPTLSQSLTMLNGRTTNDKIRQGNLIARRLKEKKSAKEIADELYVRTLCRKPTEEEWAKIEPMIAAEKDPQRVLEDFFWALLNTDEFLFNH